MKNFIKKIFKNKLYGLIFVVIVLGLGYFSYNKFFSSSNQTRYILAEVKKGTIDVSVSGTGFISPLNKVDLKSKVSGVEVVSVPVSEGQEVKAGDLIVKLDTTDPEKTVRDAQISLDNAKLSLEKLKMQYDQILRADTLNKNYQDGMNILADLYNNYSQILNNLNDILFKTDFSSINEANIKYYSDYDSKFNEVPEKAKRIYDDLKILYSKNFDIYTQVKRRQEDLKEEIILKSYDLVLKTADLIKLTRDPVLNLQSNLILNNAIHKYENLINSHAQSLTNYSNTMDNYLKNILTIRNNINSYKDSTSSYPIDIKNQELVVKQKENALLDARQKLDDYYIRAPFSGIITNITVSKGDIISGGTVATLITKNKIAEILLNEIDSAPVKIGQKAILTFDALPGKTLEGKVYEISTVGEESQGVVSYTVKINFEDGSGDVKPGMSATAKIITQTKNDVLLVPNQALKISGRTNYVLKALNVSQNDIKNSIKGGIVLSAEPQRVDVKTGISGDEFTEILEGLKEGDIIVLRVINGISASNSSNAQTQLQNKPQQSSAVFRFPGTGGGR
jgi:HlyD family secretion protein